MRAGRVTAVAATANSRGGTAPTANPLMLSQRGTRSAFMVRQAHHERGWVASADLASRAPIGPQVLLSQLTIQ